MERIVTVQQARPKLGELVQEVSSGSTEPVVITRRGVDFAVLVSRDDFAILEHAKSEDARALLHDTLGKVESLMEARGISTDDWKGLLAELSP